MIQHNNLDRVKSDINDNSKLLLNKRKTLVVFADTDWSIGRVHKDLEQQMPDYKFIYYDQQIKNYESFVKDVSIGDLCLTTLNNYFLINGLFKNMNERKKIMFVSHGVTEFSMVSELSCFTHFSNDFKYGVTSDAIVPYAPMKVYITPNGVNSSLYTYRQRSGIVKTLGWAGAIRIKIKRYDWSQTIATNTQLQLKTAVRVPFKDMANFYDSIDVFLVTSGPESSVETGPLPPFEAIMCGVLAIGTSVGNFRHIPGPKFTSIEEACNIIEDLKNNPQKVVSLAKEQYDYVMNNFTYEVLSKQWQIMFNDVLNGK